MLCWIVERPTGPFLSACAEYYIRIRLSACILDSDMFLDAVWCALNPQATRTHTPPTSTTYLHTRVAHLKTVAVCVCARRAQCPECSALCACTAPASVVCGDVWRPEIAIMFVCAVSVCTATECGNRSGYVCGRYNVPHNASRVCRVVVPVLSARTRSPRYLRCGRVQQRRVPCMRI